MVHNGSTLLVSSFVVKAAERPQEIEQNSITILVIHTVFVGISETTCHFLCVSVQNSKEECNL